MKCILKWFNAHQNRMEKINLITRIENIILQWDETSIGKGDFGSIAFLYRGKEFAHIHKNGDLDIDFGKKITSELRQKNLVQKHLYVPETSITFRVWNEEQLPFAVSLLRFSYLGQFIKASANDAAAQKTMQQGAAKLHESLQAINW